MAYVFERVRKTGTRYTGKYLDPAGVKRSTGTFKTKRAALTAAHREQKNVRAGRTAGVSERVQQARNSLGRGSAAISAVQSSRSPSC